MKSVAILLMAVSTRLSAQWLDYPDSRTPRTKKGKPNLSGVWQAERTPLSEYIRTLGTDPSNIQVDLGDITKYVSNIFWDVKPADRPLRAEAVAIVQQRRKNPTGFPLTRCLPSGIPAVLFIYTFKIIQTPQEIVVLPEDGDPPRQIYTDGRSMPKDPQPSWMGYSVGQWQGDTLAVETVGFTDKSLA
jgi:hypothetical protein